MKNATHTRRLPHTLPRPANRWVTGLISVSAGVCLGGLCAAPAQWLADALSWATHGRMQLHDVQGTVWQGSGQWVLHAGEGRRTALALPQRVHWAWHPFWHSNGQPYPMVGLALTVRAECCMPSPWVLRVEPHAKEWQIVLEAHTSHWPLAWLNGLGAPWNTVGLQGQVRLQHSDLQWAWHSPLAPASGHATLTLVNVSSALSPLKPLGTYALQVQGGTPPTLRLHTVEARLQLNAEGLFQNGRWQFSGEAQAGEGDEQVLGNLLGVLGQRRGHRSLFRWG